MPTNRQFTLANVFCTSCVFVLDTFNLFMQHLHPYPHWLNLTDFFLYFDAPLLLCAMVMVLCLFLYTFAQKHNWLVAIAIFFELCHFAFSIRDASMYECSHAPYAPRICDSLRRLLVSLFNVLLLAGGVASQSISLYRQRTRTSKTDEELIIYDDSN